jgi:hypothetical protein
LSDGIKAALEALRRLGWRVERAARRRRLPDAVSARYPHIPEEVRAFLGGLDACESRGEQAWFLTASDYGRRGGDALEWDAFEALDDDAGSDAVRAFWDAHLPILQSVAGDYAYLAVGVDPAAADYGAVVRGDAPDLTSPTPVSATFTAFLATVAACRPGAAPSGLADLLLAPDDDSRVESAPLGPLGRLARRLSALPLFERYRVGVVWYAEAGPRLYDWENWSKVTPYMSALVRRLGAETVIRPRQAGDADNWLRFGRLPWSEANNRTWTTRYLADPAMAGKVAFHRTEFWAPNWPAAFERRRGPEMFALIDKNQADDSHGFLLALRKGVLRQADVAADEVIYQVRATCGLGACVTFDRTWGEVGRFGSVITVNALDWTAPDTVLAWGRAHPKAVRRSFRWRRSFR